MNDTPCIATLNSPFWPTVSYFNFLAAIQNTMDDSIYSYALWDKWVWIMWVKSNWQGSAKAKFDHNIYLSGLMLFIEFVLPVCGLYWLIVLFCCLNFVKVNMDWVNQSNEWHPCMVAWVAKGALNSPFWPAFLLLLFMFLAVDYDIPHACTISQVWAPSSIISMYFVWEWQCRLLCFLPFLQSCFSTLSCNSCLLAPTLHYL